MIFNAFCNWLFIAWQSNSWFVSTPGFAGSDYTEIRRSLVTKTLRIMQWASFFLLGLCLQVSAGVRSQTITYSGKNVTLETAFTIIQQQTGYEVFSKAELIRSAKRITVKAENISVGDFMSEILKGQDLTFEIQSNTILVSRKSIPIEEGKEYSLLSSLPPISGRITDADGNPVAGASVMIKGTKVGAVSDANGYFSINTEPGQILIISSVEFESREIKVSGNRSLSISLTRAVVGLNEVIINKGYYTEKQKYSLGNVSKVSSDEIMRQPIANPLQALSGRVPGLFMQVNGGMPGANQQIQIRGINSVAAGNEPLIVVDGIQMENNSMDRISVVSNTNVVGGLSHFSNIVPSDIQSIEVLKDAEATSIYGSRGANGVIVITTKRGAAGKTKYNINVYQGVAKVRKFLDLLNINDYLDLRRKAFENDGITPDNDNAPDLLVWNQNRDVNWQKELIGGSANITNVQANISGGNKQTQFSFSSGYRKEGTVFPRRDLGDNRFNNRINIQHKSADGKFELFASSMLTYDQDNIIDDLTPYINLPPNYPGYINNGVITWRPDVLFEPYASLLVDFKNTTKTFMTNTNLKYNIVKDFDAKLNFGYTEMSMKQSELIPSKAQNPIYNATAISTFSNNNHSSWIIEPQLNYSFKTASGNLSLLAGGTFQHKLIEGDVIYGDGFVSDQFMGNIAAAGYTLYLENTYIVQRYASVFGRVQYNFLNKYLLSGIFRRDGSSKFGRSKQFGNFGSISGAWIFSEEEFIRSAIPFLSFGKIRTSYGLTGNDQINDYQYLSTYIATSNDYQVPGLRVTRIANNNYSWETNRKIEIALEGGILNNRLMFSVSAFKNRSGDQLVEYPLPSQSGFSNYQGNLPALVQNRGLEIQLESELIKKSGFLWNANFNISFIDNKLVQFPGIEKTSYANRFRVGHPLNMVFAYQYLGIKPEDGKVIVGDLDDNGMTNSPGDLYTYGTTLPKYYGGFFNSFKFGNIRFDILFQFAKKIARTENAIWGAESFPGSINNISNNIYKNMWTSTRNEGTYPAASTSANNYTIFNRTDYAMYEDASYINLKNINISYEINPRLLGKNNSTKLNIYIQGQNLLVFTKYKGLDPETGSMSLPNLRTMVLGMNFTF